MLRKLLVRLKEKHLEALRAQKGQSIIIFTFAVIGLIAMLGLALDLGLVYIERVKVGRTTDAAVLAGVTELSNNNELATIERAVEYIRLNGYNVGGDTEVLVRGCIATGNINENGAYASTTTPMTRTTIVTGAVYIPATVSPKRATFMIDTGSFQSSPGNCKPTANPASFGGNAQKIQVLGQVQVHMNFMQFFGFKDVPVEDQGIAENVTTLDVVVVFDISGSMEDQTICHDCWVRTTYDITNSPYPSNGYFNPLPFDPNLAPTSNLKSIPSSKLCTDRPAAWQQKATDNITRSYLTLEAELYSANVGNWTFEARASGQGFWALQRGSHGSTFPVGFTGATAENGWDQGNWAGDPNHQSSNVCNPAIPAGINCNITANDNVCEIDGVANDVIRDCSAYISARPFQTYGQTAGSIPNLSGASYNLDCFKAGTGPFTDTVSSGRCWSNDRTPGSNPFVGITGLGPSGVPWVEYDFTPTWTQTTYLWIRAIGGNRQSYTWAGASPDDLDGTPTDNIAAWRKVIYWELDNTEVHEQNDNANAAVQVFDLTDFRDNRAEPDKWRWISLGPISTTALISGTQRTLKIYQGSPGYKIDKIIFTNDSLGTTGNPPPAMRRNLTGGTEGSDGRLAFGPPVSYGSATREACNLCNPIYGNPIGSESQCSCPKNYIESKIRYDTVYTGYNPSFPGTGSLCNLDIQLSFLTATTTITVTPPEVQPPQTQERTIVNDLFMGNMPMRGAQEALKNFVMGLGVEEQYRLKPGFDQVGFVAFSGNTAGTTRAKLQCLRTLNPVPADAATCYAKVLAAVEQQWATDGTNISEGMREGLEELGLSVGNNTAVDSTCTTTDNDKHACDRGSSAKKVLILMTDGSPNGAISSCSSQSGYDDFWDGLIGANDGDFDCAMWYAEQAAEKGVIVYTIGIGAGANQDFLTTMATGEDPRKGGTPVRMFQGSGGKYFGAAKPSDMDRIFRQILTSISVRIVG